jgi:probable rRNA maturation factor
MSATQTAWTDESDDPGSGPEPADQPPPTPIIETHDRCGRAAQFDVAWVVARLREATPHIGGDVARVSVAFLDDPQMTELHERHCDLDTTTDVLTFPASGDGEPLDVEIAVCLDEAVRRAVERSEKDQRGVERELLLYCVHGLLHCTGWDDHTTDEYDAMHAREDEILRVIGVGDVFRGSG